MDVNTGEKQIVSLVYTMCANASNYTPSYTHVKSAQGTKSPSPKKHALILLKCMLIEPILIHLVSPHRGGNDSALTNFECMFQELVPHALNGIISVPCIQYLKLAVHIIDAK